MFKDQEVNIAITPDLMQYARDEGYELGNTLSRIRTVHGESWKEWFLVRDAEVDEVIKAFITHDPALHHDGKIISAEESVQRIRNGDPRLTIDLKEYDNRGVCGTGVTIYYKPARSSYDQW